jgi:hypothetical protein
MKSDRKRTTRHDQGSAGRLRAVVLPAQQFRQLGDLGGDAPGLGKNRD